ncbi:MAG: ATP-binding protein, partial [Pseudomonadota bacterium]
MTMPAELSETQVHPGEVIARQVYAISQLTPVMMIANLVNVAATFLALWFTHVIAWPTVIWAGAVSAYSLFMLLMWMRRRNRPFPERLSARTRRRVVVFAGVLGMLWAYPGLVLLPNAPPLAQAFLIALCAGMVSGGAITLYPIPRAALLYAGIIAVAHFAGFSMAGEPVFAAFAIVALMFFVVIAWSVLRHERVFTSEFLARRQLDAYAATILRLLDETRTEAVREKREAEARLAQAQRLDAVGRLTAGVAHDFNNLLAAIMGNIELAQVTRDSAEVKDLLAAALDATRRGADLTRQLLAFGRKATLMPEPVDPQTAISGLVILLQRTLPADIEFETQLATDLRRIRVDRSQLGNALLNLVINARDAMPGGGQITIAGRQRHIAADDPMAIGPDALAPGDYVMLSVSDDGAGMAKDVLEKVFEPFFTTKETGKGSGLGLAMVYGFARQSGGLATIRSRPGQGTTVSVLLPALDEAVREEEPKPQRPAAELMGATGRIMVVEDAADVRRVVAGQLRALGFDVISAPDGA